MTIVRHLVLASGSPRRRVLLRRAGFDFDLARPDVSEDRLPAEPATNMVRRLACDKAAVAAANLGPATLVLGADTAVVLDGVPLGKPATPLEAVEVLMDLSGRSHEVLTGYCLVSGGGENVSRGIVVTTVTFKVVDRDEAEAYVATGEPLDKAGSYAIQGLGRKFVAHIDGSFSNVMGLPMEVITPLLVERGFSAKVAGD